MNLADLCRSRPEDNNVQANECRWFSTAAAVLLVFAAWQTNSPGAEPPPNIVLIVADDLGWGDVGFNGRTEWATPNLDRLAGQGIVLKRCYSAATVCAPSRAAFLTGKYTIHSGVRHNDQDLPAEEVTIAECSRLMATPPRSSASGITASRAGTQGFCSPDGAGLREFFGYTDAVKAC